MKFGRLSAITALVLVLGVVNIPAAHALTDYDNLVTETQLSRLTLPLPDVCSTTDFSLNWTQGFDSVYPGSSFSDSVREDIKEAFLDTADLSTAAWSLSMKPSEFGLLYGDYAYSTVTLFFVSDATDIRTQFHLEHHGSNIYANQLRLEAVPNSASDYSWGVAYFRVDSSDCTLKMINGNTGVSTSWGGVYTVASKLISYGNRFSTQNNEFLFSNFAVDYPVGYEGELVPSTYVPPVPTYVAMGDSFSSGEGNPPFESGTNTDTNKCHRSEAAYPHLLANDPSLDLGPVNFVACSGATTQSILNGHSGTGNWNEGAQVDELSADTEVVTITIGGNDVGFKDYIEACLLSLCGPGFSAFDTITANIDSTAFLDELKQAYSDVLGEAPNADVYVITYPYIIESEGIQNCILLDRTGAKLVTDRLNTKIALAVAQVRSQAESFSARLKLVSVTENGSSFENKQLCSVPLDEASFHTTGIPIVYSFHPNYRGQENYYDLVKQFIN